MLRKSSKAKALPAEWGDAATLDAQERSDRALTKPLWSAPSFHTVRKQFAAATGLHGVFSGKRSDGGAVPEVQAQVVVPSRVVAKLASARALQRGGGASARALTSARSLKGSSGRALTSARSLKGTSGRALTTDDSYELYERSYEGATDEFEDEEVEEDVGDMDELKQKRKQQLERASHAKYRFENYPGIAKEAWLAEYASQVQDMLTCSLELIPRSLMNLEPPHKDTARTIFKSLLGYMGDKQMEYPLVLAQDILRQGLETPELRDEIYLQMMKQLTQNQVAASILKGWQLMCMCISTFPPTTGFENFLLNFLILQSKLHGIVGVYARYCLRTLQGTLEAGASGFLPSIEEIMAYDERPPVLATIALVDGMILTEDLPVTPDLNAGKVAEICAQFLELEDKRADTFGIFVYDLGLSGEDDLVEDLPIADLPRTPKPLKDDDYLGDQVVQWSRKKRLFKFVFKQKICVPPFSPSDDPMMSRLVYLQAEHEAMVVGLLGFEDEATVAELAATSLVVALSDEFPRDETSLAAMEDPTLLEFLPLSWRSKGAEYWASKILPYRAKLGVTAAEGDEDEDAMGAIIAELQESFVSTVSEHELYGAHFFYTRKMAVHGDAPELVRGLPRDLTFAINYAGVFVYDSGAIKNEGAVTGGALCKFE